MLRDEKGKLAGLVPSIPMGHARGHDDNIAFAERLLLPLAGEQSQRLCRFRKMMNRYYMLLKSMFGAFPRWLTMVLHLNRGPFQTLTRQHRRSRKQLEYVTFLSPIHPERHPKASCGVDCILSYAI